MTAAIDFDKARFNMVEQQARPWVLFDQDLREQLEQVHREVFVPAAFRSLAYADTAIPLGHGAEMLHPVVESQALKALQPKHHAKVLEVGTGSGYTAALLAVQAAHVWTIEIEPALAQQAKANLQAAGVDNVTVEVGDGLQGLPAQAPFDAILVSGAVTEIPQALLDQLKVGGRLFAVVGHGAVQTMELVTRTGDNEYSTKKILEAGASYLRQAAPRPAFTF